MQLAPRIALISTLALAGCAESGYAIELQFESPATREATRAITLTLIPDGCGAQTLGAPADAPLQERLLRRTGERPSFEPASAGRYGVYAIARDEVCGVVAAGCTEVELTPGGSGTITVRLDDLTAAACASCDDGACVSELLDAGVRDASGDAQDADAQAGPIDASSDDAGVDGGPDGGTDAGRDGGTDGGPPASLCPRLVSPIFCNDFELPPSASTGPWDPPDTRGSGAVTFISGGDVRFGARAAETYVGDDAAKAMFEVGVPAVTSGDLWVRGYFYVPASSAVDGLSVIYLRGAENGISLQLRHEGRVGAYIGPHSDATGTTTVPLGSTMNAMPRGTWACVEMHIEIASSGGIEIYVDRDLVETFAPYDTSPTSGFSRLVVGIENTAEGHPPATVRVDEVALSRTRLGC